MRILLALGPALLLAACGPSVPDDAVGGVTREEAQALNDAADMLDNAAYAPPPANESAAANAN